MARKFQTPRPSLAVTVHLPQHLAQYVVGLAKIHNESLSATLKAVVERDLRAVAAKVKEKLK